MCDVCHDTAPCSTSRAAGTRPSPPYQQVHPSCANQLRNAGVLVPYEDDEAQDGTAGGVKSAEVAR